MLGLLIAAVVGIAIGAMVAVAVIFLNREKISQFFEKLKNKHQQELSSQEKDAIGFTMSKAINDPNTPIVEGIFNKKENKVVGGYKISAQNVSSDIARKHRNSEVVIYS
ncbi:MAG: hypothetical protein LBB80_10900 [Treponema sp.]|jgi:hypothetical protein|nr:hypothetical protein [Treponema sp.]